ncbi:putative odorant receptor OR17 [Operophtera brumata]|uniref:Odorant receptor n=1 Tax=Operophtera brumata TaxID=104452 RepID=A0A0L7L8N3_OPEBR|nr:putative odorant receptor OR17 [Operophtera brumata]
MQSHRFIYDNILNHFKVELWDVVADTKEHRSILERYTTTSRLIVRFQYYYTIILVLIVILFPRIIMLYETKILDGEVQYLYPFDGWYPFDKVKWYYAAYVWESIMTTVVIFIFVFANMIHISFTRYICMELKILGSMMESLVTTEEVLNIMNRKNVDQTHAGIRTKLKITSGLDAVLGDGLLLTYSFGSVFICLTIFTATVVDNFYLRLRYTSFFCSLLVEVFVQCIIGQLLIDHSSKLEQAIYFADWPYADEGMKRILLIFLIRAQKPLTISARGYVTMNLDTFSSYKSCRISINHQSFDSKMGTNYLVVFSLLVIPRGLICQGYVYPGYGYGNPGYGYAYPGYVGSGGHSGASAISGSNSFGDSGVVSGASAWSGSQTGCKHPYCLLL